MDKIVSVARFGRFAPPIATGGMMKKLQATLLSIFTACSVGVSLTACGVSDQRSERYVSSQVQGEEQKINLEEVQKAFWDTKATDFQSWMTAFEKRVNEIYEGKEVVSIDANRKTGKLEVIGFIDNKKEAGFQQGEEKLFTIEQTGDVANDQLPYRVSGAGGVPYYEGQHSVLGNTIVQMLVMSHLMNSWGGRYYTPYSQTVILRDHRDSFRTSPTFSTQKASNQSFTSRFKEKFGGGLASKKGFGSGTFSSDTGSSSKRTWNSGSSSSSSSGWGSSSGSSGRSFSWGGRRSGGRSWGGMRR